MSLLRADARAIPLRDESVQTVVTSPPYWGLRDYGVSGQIGLERTPEEYVASIVEVFREVRRVLRGDGTVWLNLGDSYCTVPHGPKEKNAPQSFGGGGSLGRGQERDGPATNGGGHANRKPLPGLKHKDLVGIPWRVAFALQADGWWLRCDCIWSKPNPMPESVTDRPTRAHEYLFLLSKESRYFYDAEAIKEPNTDDMLWRAARGHTRGANGKVDASRGDSDALRGESAKEILANGRNRRSVWTVATQPYSGAHFATFPEKLIEPCILAGAPKGGVVLDPFGGSGTTVRVARRLQRRGVALELKPDYIELAKRRIAGVQMEMVP